MLDLIIKNGQCYIDGELKDVDVSIKNGKIQHIGQISEKAKDFIAEKGYDQKYGARPLNRAIQKYIEDLVAENVVSSAIKEGDSISIDAGKNTDEGLSLEIQEVPTV